MVSRTQEFDPPSITFTLMTEAVWNNDLGIAGLHWIRYGTAGDQKYLIGDFEETYDQLVINGNMVAHMPSSLSHFITQRAKKPFVIDPQTHAFAHDLSHLQSTSKSSNGDIKRSWKKLLGHYGEHISKILLHYSRPLDPKDFDEENLRYDFVEKVLTFQNNAITGELETGEDREYLEFLQNEKNIDPFIRPPAILIAPYFYIDGPLYEEWLDLNIELLNDARRILNSKKDYQQFLAAQLVLSKDILGEESVRNEIVQKYSKAKPNAILLWIDNFSEHNASEFELIHYKELLKGFANEEIPVVNLFGGFFSVALARLKSEIQNLSGVCHGLEYGETRPVIPLGGGIPVARFYSRQLHHRLPPRVALRVIKILGGLENVETFLEKICDCKNCESIISEDPIADLNAYFETKSSSFWRAGKRISMEFPTSIASDNCTKHYLLCKQWEYNENWNVAVLKDKFKENSHLLRKEIGSEYSGHLSVWEKLIG